MIRYFKAHLPVIAVAVGLGALTGLWAAPPPRGPMPVFTPPPEVKPVFRFCEPVKCTPPRGADLPKTMPPLVDRKYADALQDIPFHASRAPLNKKPDPVNAGHYHRVGEIYLAHAYYTLGARAGKVSEEARKELEKAHLYLYAIRPVPRYAYWSKALYQDAMVLELLGNDQGKMADLEVIARVRSTAPAASLARVYLAGLMVTRGRCSRAMALLKGAVAIPEEYRDMARYIRLRCSLGNEKKFINNFKELYSKTPKKLRPWILWEYAGRVAPTQVDMDWLGALPREETRCAASRLYSNLDRKAHPSLALRLCSIMR